MPISITAELRQEAAEAQAQVAQLVEHVTENHGVGGSIPPLGTTPFRKSRRLAADCVQASGGAYAPAPACQIEAALGTSAAIPIATP